jgi:uncharacterized membrane protein YozB (DUF420 family)
LNEGFLGTAAPRYADLVLLLEIGMGVGLLAGALLARMRRFRAHAWCQSTIVLLNVAIIVLVMVPSFQGQVSPNIPLKLCKAYYALTTAHAALGTVVACAGLYILLAAGTKLLPERFRITRYKLWMRSVLVAWWVVLLLGLATYARWYIPHPFPRRVHRVLAMAPTVIACRQRVQVEECEGRKPAAFRLVVVDVLVSSSRRQSPQDQTKWCSQRICRSPCR